MAVTTPLSNPAESKSDSRLRAWLLSGAPAQETEGPLEGEHASRQHPWWQVMCLTGVDYFSTLGYQPGIAALAAGALAPIATLILVLVTLFGALPMYKRVAVASPHGDGSISMLERLLSWWQGKLLVLCLIGFMATGFIITITLSAADATAHIQENPFTSFLQGYEVPLTLLLIGLLGAVFLKGFSEAIGVAVGLVVVYLSLNVLVIGASLLEIARHPQVLHHWQLQLSADYGNPLLMIGAALLLFPKLALGLSGFETGVLVMPLVKGDPTDTPQKPLGRIRNTHRLLTTAALIMSVMLILSSLVTTVLIPPAAFESGGAANGRALAYLAHDLLSNWLATLYDISTITILWFAGASALAGLLNIMPRFMPRYGMAPGWTRAHRPLVLVFTIIGFLVTVAFSANVDAQAGAYATGVLAVITTASVAVALAARSKHQRKAFIYFSIVALLFIYTTLVTIVTDSQGLKIALMFIAAIVVVSLVSRSLRSTELRATGVTFDDVALRFLSTCEDHGELRIIANHPDERTSREYLLKEREEREASNIPSGAPVLFLEVTVADASEFAPSIRVVGQQIGEFKILRAIGASVPNTIAAVLLGIRDQTGCRPHAYFGWTEGNPLKYLARFIFFGEGDIAPVTHEVLRKAEPDPQRRPAVHVG